MVEEKLFYKHCTCRNNEPWEILIHAKGYFANTTFIPISKPRSRIFFFNLNLSL